MPLLKLAFQLFIIKLIKDKIMTYADDMKAALPALQAQHGLTSDQVNDILTKALTPIQTTISGILTSEKSDEDKLADIGTALTELTSAYTPAAPTSTTDSASTGQTTGTPVADSAPATDTSANPDTNANPGSSTDGTAA